MRFEFDEQGYVCCILYGCYTGTCQEYTGRVPTEPEVYEDMDDWANRAQTQAYKLDSNGNLIYDAARAAALPEEDAIEPLPTEYLKKLGVIDAIYPVGSIYMSVNDVSPEMLFGGTWEQIEDKFLLASGMNYAAGATGGAASQTIAAHKHLSPIGHRNAMKGIALSGKYGYVSSQSFTGEKAVVTSAKDTSSYSDVIVPYTNEAGSTTVSTMPPYLAVFVWKRTA